MNKPLEIPGILLPERCRCSSWNSLCFGILTISGCLLMRRSSPTSTNWKAIFLEIFVDCPSFNCKEANRLDTETLNDFRTSAPSPDFLDGGTPILVGPKKKGQPFTVIPFGFEPVVSGTGQVVSFLDVHPFCRSSWQSWLSMRRSLTLPVCQCNCKSGNLQSPPGSLDSRGVQCFVSCCLSMTVSHNTLIFVTAYRYPSHCPLAVQAFSIHSSSSSRIAPNLWWSAIF